MHMFCHTAQSSNNSQAQDTTTLEINIIVNGIHRRHFISIWVPNSPPVTPAKVKDVLVSRPKFTHSSAWRISSKYINEYDKIIYSVKHNTYIVNQYEVRQFNCRNVRSVSLGCWVRQTRVLKHVCTCSNLRLLEPQTKWVIRSRAAEEAVRDRGVRLAEKWVTRIWRSGLTPITMYIVGNMFRFYWTIFRPILSIRI
jgi:hypothetical protein